MSICIIFDSLTVLWNNNTYLGASVKRSASELHYKYRIQAYFVTLG